MILAILGLIPGPVFLAFDSPIVVIGNETWIKRKEKPLAVSIK